MNDFALHLSVIPAYECFCQRFLSVTADSAISFSTSPPISFPSIPDLSHPSPVILQRVSAGDKMLALSVNLSDVTWIGSCHSMAHPERIELRASRCLIKAWPWVPYSKFLPYAHTHARTHTHTHRYRCLICRTLSPRLPPTPLCSKPQGHDRLQHNLQSHGPLTAES